MVVCQAAIQRIVDGDTLDVVARVWPGQTASERVRLTCRGQTAVDAWEKRGAERPLGEVATAFVRQELTGCEWVLLVVGDERDNFGRLLAGVLYLPRCDDLWTILNDGIDLGAGLIDKGYATPYVRDVVDVVDGPIQPVPAGWEA